MADIPKGAHALTFSFSTQALRVVLRDGNPWFVAADVCQALGLARTDDGVGRLDDDEKGAVSIRTPGGEQQMTVVNESGLYSLILGSRKPEAKKFKKWVTGEVLPSIRKTGRYETAAVARQASERLSNADLMNIKRLVWHATHRYHSNQTWTQGVWFHLRRALDVPSPYPFAVDHLPRLAAELARVAHISNQVTDIVRKIEHEAVRRIFRRGEDADAVIAALEADAAKYMAGVNEDIAKLPSYIARDVREVLERGRSIGYDHDNEEVPGAIKAIGGAS